MPHHLTQDNYHTMYKKSVQSPDEFWGDMANKFISWEKTWNSVDKSDFTIPHVEWFSGAKLNVCYNCVDRHLPHHANKTALIWEGDDPNTPYKKLTYQELYEEVCKFSHVLKELHVKKGDRICLYMPMITEAIIAMLACSRIGAIHNIIFAGFSAEALYNRIESSNATVVITATSSKRANKDLLLKNIVDDALTKGSHNVKHVLVIRHIDCKHSMLPERDIYYHNVINKLAKEKQDWSFKPEIMDSNDPLFILYTSGSTGKPKGIVHGSGGYLLYSAMTFYYSFDYKENDIFWCSADIGWITGHSYTVYGALCNGATTLIFEGGPSHPSYTRFWDIIDKHQISIFYTAPTAIRAIRAQGDDCLKTTTRASLRILGSVGEPINNDVWKWYNDKVGHNRCHISDTWWQTETGGHMIVSLPGATATLKPGCATLPFFGIQPCVINQDDTPVQKGNGLLYIKKSWPGQMIGLYNDQKRFHENYFHNGYYVSGDGVTVDDDGHYWITGRVDDVINVSGHRLGTAEIETALLQHNKVCEVAVIGAPHPIKGEGIYAYIVPANQLTTTTDNLKKELAALCIAHIGGIAKPDDIYIVEDLPKTRSGKIMRRILRKIAQGRYDDIGDISTLANPQSIQKLIKK